MKAARPVRKGADGKVLRSHGVTRRRPTLHDSHGRVSVNHLVDERGYGVMLNKREPDRV